MSGISVSVQAQPEDAASWAALARRVEEAGFAALLAADHPGGVASPFVALAAAGAVTSRIGLGTYVSQAGVREPLLLASDVATLDVVSGGRAMLGIGAGHTPAEWAMLGGERPGAAERVARCVAVAEACRALLAGEEVTSTGPYVRASAARLDAPRPVGPVPLTIGGGNTELLRWAGRHADVVGLSGLGRTLPDGMMHEARWRPADVDRQVGLVAEGAAGRSGPPPVLEALVQAVEITTDAEAAAREFAARVDTDPADMMAVPYAWFGTEEEILAELAAYRERWGITRYVVRDAALEAVAPLLARLAEDTGTG